MNIKIHIPEPIERILTILHDAGGKPRLVGGAVRDAIVGLKNADIDLITIFEPDVVTDILTKHNVFVKATGIKYGTVTAILDNENTQITTLRIDKDCDGRRLNAEFTDDFEADAKRRDFTINAMSYCPFEKKLYDYAGGYDDLMAGRVVFIREPSMRIEEDYLRILRFFRFSDKFAKTIDEPSLKACIKLRHGLMQLSKERVLMELKKLLESHTCHKTLRIMIENDILKEVMLVDLSLELLDIINIYTKEADVCTRFAALMYKNKSKTLWDDLYKMHFSIRDIDTITALVRFREEHPDLCYASLKDAQNVFYTLWVGNIYHDSYMLISEYWNSKNFDVIRKKMHEKPPIFPVDGYDILDRGISGHKIRDAIAVMRAAWIESEFTMEKDALLGMV